MHKNGETQESMADKLGTSSKSLRDWLNDPAHKVTADFVVIVSLMWKLPDWISDMLLESAGIQLNERDRRHRALEYILDLKPLVFVEQEFAVLSDQEQNRPQDSDGTPLRAHRFP